MKLGEADRLIGQEQVYCIERSNSARFPKKLSNAFDNSFPNASDLDRRLPMESTEKNSQGVDDNKRRKAYISKACIVR